MFTVTKKFEFEASHKLSLPYESACKNLHGHSYKCEITIKSERLNDEGMVIDFSKINTIKEWVLKHWDHSTLIPYSPTEELMEDVRKFCGKVFDFPYPNVTAEYMCLFLHDLTCKELGISPLDVKITLFETSNNYATFEPSRVDPNTKYI